MDPARHAVTTAKKTAICPYCVIWIEKYKLGWVEAFGHGTSPALERERRDGGATLAIIGLSLTVVSLVISLSGEIDRSLHNAELSPAQSLEHPMQ